MVRALALIGVVVMNYHGYLIIRGATRGGSALDRFFDPWTGPLSTRFAATFVLVAGVSATLLVASRRDDPAAVSGMRLRLVRRGVVLYLFGLWFDTIWNGTILPYYGAMFAIAGLIITWRSRWVLTLGAASAISAAARQWWRTERELDGHDTGWFERGDGSPRLLLFDVFINGTHPLLPWLMFFCAGIVLGRYLRSPSWRPFALGVGLTSFGLATIISDAITGDSSAGPVAVMLASNDPFDRGLLYVASALGTALVAMAAISWAADRWADSPVIRLLQTAGQMSLTLYVAHALLFNLVVDWLDWVQPAGLGTALVFALSYWVIGLLAAWVWSRRFTRGPLEIMYRRLTR